MASAAHLTLPHWDGGSRKIRFLYLQDGTSFRLSECPNKDRVIPLYLGADVLYNTDVRTENHPRFHAKLAKKGLATKVHFAPAFRFQGLKVPASNTSLWFYSVQGLFRVAFEMYNKKEQLAVVEDLQVVLKAQINDSVLNASYSLDVQLDVCDTEARTETPLLCGQPVDRRSEVKGGRDTADHDYCSSPKTSSQTEQSRLVRRKLHSLDQQLSSEPASCAERLRAALLLLESVDRLLSGDAEEACVADAALALLQAGEWSSAYSSPLLSRVGRWLGQQFHAANGSISQRVEGFKVQHIERISDLPPAEELAAQLFPEAMQALLLHWMGLSDDSALGKRRSEYPILLLILEFANHNLITGVAHVLYSSLICK